RFGIHSGAIHALKKSLLRSRRKRKETNDKRYTRSHANKRSNQVNNVGKNIVFFSLQPTKVHLPSLPSMRVRSSSDPHDLLKKREFTPDCASASRVARSLCLSCI